MSGPQPRPITILIAALGGEGGGVLTDWIVAGLGGLSVQSTSIPGVAQHTGATTYCISVPTPRRAGETASAGAAAGVGDAHRAGELLRPAAPSPRVSSPDRTLMITSTTRSFGGGREWATAATMRTGAGRSRTMRKLLSTWKRWPGACGTVMLGIIAGCRRRRSPPRFSKRPTDGKSVDAISRLSRRARRRAQRPAPVRRACPRAARQCALAAEIESTIAAAPARHHHRRHAIIAA
jgi:indolepyruvate ferredoxin oxidoreductase beta subunit